MLRGGYPCRKSGGIFAHGNCVLANFATLRIAEGYPQTIADRFRSPDRTLCADLISLGFFAFAIRKKTTIEENPVTKRFIGARVEALRADRERSQDDLVLLFGFKDRQTVLAIETGMRRVTAGR